MGGLRHFLHRRLNVIRPGRAEASLEREGRERDEHDRAEATRGHVLVKQIIQPHDVRDRQSGIHRPDLKSDRAYQPCRIVGVIGEDHARGDVAPVNYALLTSQNEVG